jgi:zinc protease
MGAVGGTISNIVNFGLNEDFYEKYPDRVRNLKISDLSDAAKKTVHPDNAVWVVVGDRAKIEAGIKELGYGEVLLIDSEGNPAK